MTIEYTLEFHSYWHCGSGLAAGPDVDALVIKDRDGLPYVPGKTIKGLVLEAMKELMCLKEKKQHIELEENDVFFNSFGITLKNKNNVDQEGCIVAKRSEVFFGNAELDDATKDAICQGKMAEYMYDSVSSTKIENGVAEQLTLRKMQVTIPCKLYGAVYFVPEEMGYKIKEAMQMIKAIGQNRNRGLGRCTFTCVIDNGKENKQ